jgi:hypothetical protein
MASICKPTAPQNGHRPRGSTSRRVFCRVTQIVVPSDKLAIFDEMRGPVRGQKACLPGCGGRGSRCSHKPRGGMLLAPPSRRSKGRSDHVQLSLHPCQKHARAGDAGNASPRCHAKHAFGPGQMHHQRYSYASPRLHVRAKSMPPHARRTVISQNGMSFFVISGGGSVPIIPFASNSLASCSSVASIFFADLNA